MPDLISLAAAKAIAKRTIRATPSARISPESVDRAGNVMNIVVAIGHGLAQEVEHRTTSKLAALTYAGAFGSELDALVAERTFGVVTRLGAAPATCATTLARPTTAGGGGTVAAGSRVELNGVTFALETDVVFSASDLTRPGVLTATVAGSATNVPASSITESNTFVLDAPFDATIAFGLDEAPAGGRDQEKDAELVLRAQDFPSTVQKGVLAAIEYGALTVAGISRAVAYEPLDANGDPYGKVILYIADINGQANSTLCTAVRQVLAKWRCCGIKVSVVGSVPSYQDIRLHVSALTGYLPADIEARCRAAVIAYVNALDPSKPLERSGLFAALRSVTGAVVGDGAIISPALDVTPLAGESIRTREESISFE